jgi:pimeloyl-ACP methyl ester carboxylesterase
LTAKNNENYKMKKYILTISFICIALTTFGQRFSPNSDKPAGKYAKVNGINLYYEIHGVGKPLVFIHGNGGSMADIGEHMDYFSKRYTVITIDSRGQGKSIDDNSELTYELMASDINELLEQLRIDSTFIWGQSDGAILAIIIAMNYPDKVKKVVAFAANMVADTIGLEVQGFRSIEKKAKYSLNKKEKQLNALMWKHPNIPVTRLQAIKADILVMSGDRDFIPLSHTIDIFKNIPNSNLCIIPGATHGAAWEKPKLFQEIVTDFFEKQFAKPNTIFD